jgi:SAM-dependent methyltransferase
MNEESVHGFWQSHPCGDFQVGGSANYADYESFFTAYDKFRYAKEAHILDCLDEIEFSGKDTLEIGLGQGADAEQIIRRGAIWSGIDLTEESVFRVQTRFRVRKLPYRALHHGSVLDLPFPDNSFDIVFSHGVLHHVPDIEQAQREIHRVLRPDGTLVVMLYAKWSLNHILSISIVRRLGLIVLKLTGRKPRGIYGQHLNNARAMGLISYLKLANFIHRNTDGPLNPYSKLYDRTSVEGDFPLFRIERIFKRFMHAPPLPVRWMPLERQLGWHLWVHLVPSAKRVKKAEQTPPRIQTAARIENEAEPAVVERRQGGAHGQA